MTVESSRGRVRSPRPPRCVRLSNEERQQSPDLFDRRKLQSGFVFEELFFETVDPTEIAGEWAFSWGNESMVLVPQDGEKTMAFSRIRSFLAKQNVQPAASQVKPQTASR
jgi:hypothetical protein